MKTIAWIIGSYLLGSIPVGVILSMLKGKDPRQAGSGNIGATNVMRTAGKLTGIVTLLGDAAKGFIPVFFAMRFIPDERIVAAVGFAAFFGHLYPLYLKFKGGKGIATFVGILLAISPTACGFFILIFLIVLFGWRYVSASSIVAAASAPFSLFFLEKDTGFVLLASVMFLFSCIRHRENLKRLFLGTENRFTLSRKSS